MAEKSAISWTHSTFNPWIGCTKVSDGCRFCYAEADMDKRRGRVKWGPAGTRSKTSEAYWREPFKWNKAAQAAGERRRVFCASLADVFEAWDGPIVDHRGLQLWKRDNGDYTTSDDYPDTVALTMDDLRRDLFTTINDTPWLDWLLLSKRPENIKRMWQPRNMVNDYPILEKSPTMLAFPYELLRQHEAQALKNHTQSLARLKERGGLAASEVLAIMEDREWYKVPFELAMSRLQELRREAGSYRRNVWLGTSPCDQVTADESIPQLLKCRDLVPVLWASYEPALGAVDWSKWLAPCRTCNGTGEITEDHDYCSETLTCPRCMGLPHLDWIVCGGESSQGGSQARPFHLEWARSTLEQCRAAGVKFFMKQLGSNALRLRQIILDNGQSLGDLIPMHSYKTGQAVKDRAGADPEEWPAELRVQEFPEVPPCVS